MRSLRSKIPKLGIQLVFHGDDSKQEEFFGACIERGVMRYIPYDVEDTGVSTTQLVERAAHYYRTT